MQRYIKISYQKGLTLLINQSTNCSETINFYNIKILRFYILFKKYKSSIGNWNVLLFKEFTNQCNTFSCN